MADSLSLPPFSRARDAEWRPGRAESAIPHGEVFASGHEAAGAALALALAMDRKRSAETDPLTDALGERAWLWVQDASAIRLGGRPYCLGLPVELRHHLIHVAAKTPEDALFALEEGLRCRELAFVFGEIAGNPKALDFTASRRLSLAVERHGVPLWLVRLDAERDLGSARMRWHVDSTPSPQPRWNAQAPGAPSWRAELFRARNHPPGKWTLRDDGNSLVAAKITDQLAAPHSGDLADAVGDRSLAAH